MGAAEVHHLDAALLPHLNHRVNSRNGRVLWNNIRHVRVSSYVSHPKSAHSTDKKEGLLRKVLLPKNHAILHDFKSVWTVRHRGPIWHRVAGERRSLLQRQRLHFKERGKDAHRGSTEQMPQPPFAVSKRIRSSRKQQSSKTQSDGETRLLRIALFVQCEFDITNEIHESTGRQRLVPSPEFELTHCVKRVCREWKQSAFREGESSERTPCWRNWAAGASLKCTSARRLLTVRSIYTWCCLSWLMH